METNAGRDHSGQYDSKNVINTLKQRCPGSISISLWQTNKGEGKENLPQKRKTQMSKQPEKGSGSCSESTTLQVSPQAGIRANPQQNQEHSSQRAGEGDKNKHEPPTASSTFHPISLQRENQVAPKALFLGRRRGCGRKLGKINTLEHNMAAKGHNSASPHQSKVSSFGTKIQYRTLIPHQKSQPLPHASDTEVSTSSDMLHLLKKLQFCNTIKQVNEGSLAKHDMQQSMNQNPNLSYNSKSTPQRQQPKRQHAMKPQSKRKVIRITVQEDSHEAEKICFVLSEVAKAFHCSVSMGVEIQNCAGPGGIGNWPVSPHIENPEGRKDT